MKLETSYVTIDGHSSRFIGDIANDQTIRWRNRIIEVEKRVIAYWDIPKKPKYPGDL